MLRRPCVAVLLCLAAVLGGLCGGCLDLSDEGAGSDDPVTVVLSEVMAGEVSEDVSQEMSPDGSEDGTYQAGQDPDPSDVPDQQGGDFPDGGQDEASQVGQDAGPSDSSGQQNGDSPDSSGGELTSQGGTNQQDAQAQSGTVTDDQTADMADGDVMQQDQTGQQDGGGQDGSGTLDGDVSTDGSGEGEGSQDPVLVGVEIFVDAENGNDDNSGTGGWDDAFRTLAKAMSIAVPGCTIYLRGTFNECLEPSVSGEPGMPIRVVGPAVIDTLGRGYALALRGICWYEFEDITFRVMNASLPDGDYDQPGTKQYSVGVAILSEGACYNTFRRCVFINAGLGSNRACVEIYWLSDHNVLEDCLAISESVGDKSFGRRAYLIAGSNYNRLINCANYGPGCPGPGGSLYSGVGVGVTIYGSIYNGSHGLVPYGTLLPCVGNEVIGHESYGTFAYAFGFTAGYSWVQDNIFRDCIAYVSDKAYAGCYANIQLSKGGVPENCSGNKWINCRIVGGTRGFWVNGMPGCIAEQCEVVGVPGVTRVGYELRVMPETGTGGFTVVNCTAEDVEALYGPAVEVISQP